MQVNRYEVEGVARESLVIVRIRRADRMKHNGQIQWSPIGKFRGELKPVFTNGRIRVAGHFLARRTVTVFVDDPADRQGDGGAAGLPV